MMGAVKDYDNGSVTISQLCSDISVWITPGSAVGLIALDVIGFLFSPKCNIPLIPSAEEQTAGVNLHRRCHLTSLHGDLWLVSNQ